MEQTTDDDLRKRLARAEAEAAYMRAVVAVISSAPNSTTQELIITLVQEASVALDELTRLQQRLHELAAIINPVVRRTGQPFNVLDVENWARQAQKAATFMDVSTIRAHINLAVNNILDRIETNERIP